MRLKVFLAMYDSGRIRLTPSQQKHPVSRLCGPSCRTFVCQGFLSAKSWTMMGIELQSNQPKWVGQGEMFVAVSLGNKYLSKRFFLTAFEYLYCMFLFCHIMLRKGLDFLSACLFTVHPSLHTIRDGVNTRHPEREPALYWVWHMIGFVSEIFAW